MPHYAWTKPVSGGAPTRAVRRNLRRVGRARPRARLPAWSYSSASVLAPPVQTRWAHKGPHRAKPLRPGRWRPNQGRCRGQHGEGGIERLVRRGQLCTGAARVVVRATAARQMAGAGSRCPELRHCYRPTHRRRGHPCLYVKFPLPQHTPDAANPQLDHLKTLSPALFGQPAA